MGLIRAAIGAIGGTLADQWIDFLTVPAGISQTAAVFPAALQGTNAGRGSNIKGSLGVITNGTRIVIPEGYGLLTFQDGGLTSLVTDPGAYIWDSNSIESRSVFVEGNIASVLLEQSWERFRYGGRPQGQQIALFVSLKELPNNKFGTQSPIYWDDAFLNTQVGATTRGTYSLKIVDPILFIQNLVPASYLQNLEVFDFTDPGNDVAMQLFNEVVASLAAAFSSYTNNASNGNRISNIQRDSVSFSASLSQAIDSAFHWRTERGLTITKAAILGIEYDEHTRELLKTVQRADALSGSRGNVNLQASVAAGLEMAGNVSGASGIVGLGVAAGGVGISSLQQESSRHPNESANSARDNQTTPGPSDPNDLVRRLAQLKQAFDADLITMTDYENAKSKLLDL